MLAEKKKVSFIADDLVAEAIQKTGLNDFGTEPYRDGLEALLKTYDNVVEDPNGREKCRARVLSQLETRLRWEQAYKQNPEIQEQEIKAPIFVTGLPRSGTSALLNLLAVAPENRAPLQWEIQFPDLWPGTQPGQEDPRYPYLVKALEETQNKAFQKIHYVDADTPEECVLLHAFAFDGAQLGFEGLFEPYGSWMKSRSLENLYIHEKKQLQMLNWRNPGQQWMLKAPSHMWGIDAIMKVFPDARFIWCHRDPQHVVPSINSMNRMVMEMYAGDCSHLEDVGQKVMDWYATSLERALAVRETLPEELFIDCSQKECAEQPVALVERIYDHFDLELSETSRSAIQTHVDANPKNKHGKHEYNLEAYGLTEDMINQRFEFYLNDSRWPISD